MPNYKTVPNSRIREIGNFVKKKQSEDALEELN